MFKLINIMDENKKRIRMLYDKYKTWLFVIGLIMLGLCHWIDDDIYRLIPYTLIFFPCIFDLYLYRRQKGIYKVLVVATIIFLSVLWLAALYWAVEEALTLI